MTDTIEDLVKRLQESCPPSHDLSDPWPGALCAEAATTLEAQAAEIKRLKDALNQAGTFAFNYAVTEGHGLAVRDIIWDMKEANK